MAQTSGTLLLIRPSHFGFNNETAASNTFQNRSAATDTALKARLEFDRVTRQLTAENIETIIIDDQPKGNTPDAVFPNNWVSFHGDGKVILYPMETHNRRRERRLDVIEKVCEITGNPNPEIIDLTYFEEKGHYLEGTGSIVFDHINKKAFVALSSRSQVAPIEKVSEITGYKFYTFHTSDFASKPIYHTNVMMSIGNDFTIICDDCISEKSSRDAIIKELEISNRQLISIDGNQMNAFAGNLLEVKNRKGDPFIVLSEKALASFKMEQRKALEQCATLLPVSIPVIENIGGGSIRCMLAEVFFDPKQQTPGVTISNPATTAEFDACYSLRWKVLRAPWNQPPGSERDDQEATSQHFMALLNGKITGTARLQEFSPGIAQVRYMAVDPDYHGKGIGKLLLQAMEKAALKAGYQKIFLQARENAVPFYKSAGYKIIEKTFLLYGEIQHYSMEKILR